MGLLSKFKGKMDYLLRQIVLYGCQLENMDNRLLQEKFIYQEVEQIKQLNNLKFDYDVEDYRNRFQQNHILCFWKDGDRVISYGWLNPNEKHFLGELSLDINLENKVEVLYDFFTKEAYRGEGLYPSLLQKMSLRNSKPKLIYAFSHNFSSIKGIEKAGFVFLGKIRGYNKKNYHSLIRRLWQK